MLTQHFIHRKHMDLVLFENTSQSLVASDLSLVFGILEIIRFEIGPESLDSFWTGELLIILYINWFVS